MMDQCDDVVTIPAESGGQSVMEPVVPRPQDSLEEANSIVDGDIHEYKEEGEYMLRWSAHNTQLIHVFHQLCQAEEFTDVTIATEAQQFKAHKLILSACSPYFRKLFLATPCKHPVVFIKDISDHHMRLLLEYMYRGSIAVKQHELEEVLSAASALKIRGLTTATLPDHLNGVAPIPTSLLANPPTDKMRVLHQTTTATTPSEDEEAPLVVDESVVDKFHHVETCSSISGKSGSRKPEGRKSSVPKKLRLSTGDSHHNQVSEDIEVAGGHSPPHTAWFLPKPTDVAADLRTSSGSSADNHGSPVGNLTDTEADIDHDQPVDFSTNNGSKIDLAPRYSILGSYLKHGLPGLDDVAKRNEIAEDLRRNGYGGATWLTGLEQLTGLKHHQQHRPASRDSRGDSREERNSSGEDNEKDPKGSPPPLGSLTDSLGIDIAGRLRSHFLANLPTQSYAWLNGMSNGNMGSLNSLASMSQLGASMGPLSGLGSLNSLPPTKESSGNRGRRGSTDKIDKNPVGGVRTGEIGANGKPSVACEVCGKKLADPSSLYRHRKIHSGDKPHQCPYCPRRFIQRYNMKQHIKTHRIELMADQSSEQLTANSQQLTAAPQNITT